MNDTPAEWAEDAHRFVRDVRRVQHGDSGRPKGKPLVYVRCKACGKVAATIEQTLSGELLVLEPLSGERFTYLIHGSRFKFLCLEHGPLDVTPYAVGVWTTEARERDTPVTKKAEPRASGR